MGKLMSGQAPLQGVGFILQKGKGEKKSAPAQLLWAGASGIQGQVWTGASCPLWLSTGPQMAKLANLCTSVV